MNIIVISFYNRKYQITVLHILCSITADHFFCNEGFFTNQLSHLIPRI